MSRPPARPIKRLLIANRGEIATRIICSARELEIETYAVFIAGDSSHARSATHAFELPSAATFLSIEKLVEFVKEHEIDAVHPGYGFLSESDEFASRMWHETGAVLIGPGWEVLQKTGDKLKARRLAEECNVPVLAALRKPTDSVDDVRKFATQTGYPIMVKATDGGGGRGIRLIHHENQLDSAVKRALDESPSRQLFAEKAAVNGFRHVEVQIIGDGTGCVTHLWERECSIQRRFQKIVEVAPSNIDDRALIAKIIDSALTMAKHVQYFSLGTFEFLANPVTKEFYFLEINPRLQVEHTVTEAISMTDIVRAQLLLAQGANLNDCGLPIAERLPRIPPPAHSIQLRVTAENPQSDWSLSIGKITSFALPSGNGIRVDTHLAQGHPTVVSTDFDSLIAKIIVTASSWESTVRKAQRALEDTHITGVKTNIDLLKAVVAHRDFLAGQCDTQWLESKQRKLIEWSVQSRQINRQSINNDSVEQPSTTGISTVNTLLRGGDAWSVTISSPNGTDPNNRPPPHHLELARVLRNDFPTSLSAELLFTVPASTLSEKAQTTPYTITLQSTTSSAAAATSGHRRGNPSDPSHISIPFSGKLVEVQVDEGDIVKEGDVICVVQQMKMELEVRAPRSGRITWVTEAEDGEEIGEGTLAAIVEVEKNARL